MKQLIIKDKEYADLLSSLRSFMDKVKEQDSVKPRLHKRLKVG